MISKVEMSQRYCRIHKPGVPNGPAFQQKVQPSRRRCRRRATPGPAQITNDRPEERSSLRPEGLAAYSSSPTSAVGADWERPTGDVRSVTTQESGESDKARRSSQPQYRGPYPAHLQDSTARPCQKGAL